MADIQNITGAYYETHSAKFIAETQSLDVSQLYTRFLQHLPPQGYILDAGCGSGRDSKAFKDKGYSVLAIDSCPAFVTQTQVFAGVEAQTLDFQTLNFQAEFDGIWACASLLHLPPEELRDAFLRLQRALKPSGCMYASFKHGDFRGVRQGRWFTDLDLQGLQSLLPAELDIIETWQTQDHRIERVNEMWFNTLLCRKQQLI
jgi:SAM-dependent methyltransferase